MAATPSDRVPDTETRSVSGTRTQISPVASTPVISVPPTPIMKAPKAPPVVEWLSAPTQNMPGFRWPFSGSTPWQMPCSG